jgi:histone H3/H4
MADFGFMRSGLSNDPVNVSEDFTNRLMSITLTMITRAATDAATYCEHAGRTNVSEEDIAASLKRQAMHFATDESLEEDVLETQRILFDEDESEDEDEGTEDEGTESEYETGDDESEDEEDEPNGEWTRSTCTCDLCRTMNESMDEWNDWAPEDPVEQYLKGTIERSIEAANERTLA